VSPIAYTFGRRLRDQRERRGISLETVAANTKISASLLAALERGDLSTWPGGIFRRAFVREYATAIGISPEPIVAELSRLFPDQSTVGDANAPDSTGDLRMSLAFDRRWAPRVAFVRVMTALIEVCVIVAIARVAAKVEGADPGTVCAIVALVYYSLAAACLGQSLGSWCVQSGFHMRRKPARQVAATDSPDPVHWAMRSSPPREEAAAPDSSSGALDALRAASR
jgi:transcriptional regulator with XRE-family HTH domain